MTKLNTIIVDDEIDACEGIALLLSGQQDINIVATCRTFGEAVEQINALQPDLVFLDIQMPGGNGFEVLKNLKPEVQPVIVFVTAYDEYALEAFEVHALDYLLKPFTDDRFFQALDRAREQLKHQTRPRYNALHDSAQAILPLDGRLKIRSSGKVMLLEMDEVIYFEGFDYYIKVHTATRFYLVRESLKQLLTRLPKRYVRIHKSSIINLSHLKSLEPLSRGNYEVTLSHGKQLVLSRNYRDSLSDWL